jgi:predicted P-loop ATPase
MSAKSSEAEIRRQWAKSPNANIGLLCGDWSQVTAPKSKDGTSRTRKWIVVLDVDAKAGEDGKTGLEVLEEWETQNGKLPSTPRQRTRNGGLHYLFLHPGGEIITRSNILPKIDVRGDNNGQIVVSPSPGYEWEVSPFECPLAPVPAELLKLISAPKKESPSKETRSYDPPSVSGWPTTDKRIERARKYLEKVPAAISGDNGHDRTWWAAMNVVRGFALGEVEAFGVLWDYNQRCDPPWSEKELRHKIRSAIDQAKMPWGKLLDNRPPPPPPRNVNPKTGEVEDWRNMLLRDGRGNVKSNLANAITILTNTDGWKDAVVHDDFASRIVLMHPTPAHEGQPSEVYPRQWRDSDDILTAAWFQRELEFDLSPRSACDVVVGLAQKNRVHPVRKYLTGLRWDGVQRLPTWLRDYMGAEDNPYTRAVGTKWLISAVARIMRPGCQADCMLIFEGEQGAGKSSSIKILVTDAWFTDQLADLNSGKEPSQDLAGKWIVEMAELDAMSRSGTLRTKAFISRQTDHFRSSYGRHSEDRPRQCVFCGTTNADCYFTDETGNRRYWPVKVLEAQKAALTRDKDQIWAEAVARFESGETWYIDDPKILAMAKEEQADRYQSDAWERVIAKWLESPNAKNILAQDGFIGTEDILACALGIEKGRWERREQTRVGACMIQLGWTKRRFSVGNRRVWGYVECVSNFDGRTTEVDHVEF